MTDPQYHNLMLQMALMARMARLATRPIINRAEMERLELEMIRRARKEIHHLKGRNYQ